MADWQEVTVHEGDDSVTVPVPIDVVSVPPGQVRGTDGTKFQGRARVRFHLEPTDDGTGTVVSLHHPAPADLVIRYKTEGDDE
jgi:hypothetical protein